MTTADTQARPAASHATPQRWLRLTILSWLTLIALLLVWHQRVPTAQPLLNIALALVPLLLPGIGLLKAKRNAVLALAVIALLYFCHAVVTVMSGREVIWGAAEVLVSICLFVSSTFTARLLR